MVKIVFVGQSKRVLAKLVIETPVLQDFDHGGADLVGAAGPTEKTIIAIYTNLANGATIYGDERQTGGSRFNEDDALGLNLAGGGKNGAGLVKLVKIGRDHAAEEMDKLGEIKRARLLFEIAKSDAVAHDNQVGVGDLGMRLSKSGEDKINFFFGIGAANIKYNRGVLG